MNSFLEASRALSMLGSFKAIPRRDEQKLPRRAEHPFSALLGSFATLSQKQRDVDKKHGHTDKMDSQRWLLAQK